jgi:aspartyl-tRNA(Asn)/glutamyl-tRNA(Gln) amidotransferase subunit B
VKIGLEVHLQLPTRSKMFCSCPTSSDGPNSSICPTCLGFPGSRPRINLRAMEMGLSIASFLECEIPDVTWFSRKTYFYPDLPKNFQITQYDSPIGERGRFVFRDRTIRITRVHLEEDPGKIKRVGKPGEEISLLDYNRSGIPLVEIVTEPDLKTPGEAREFMSNLLTELRGLVGLKGSDEQTVRVDANISVGKERVEIKNILGLKNLERGLKFEAVRQTRLLKARKKVVRETRRFDEERKVTLAARKKEFEEDYGYIGEPDLGVFHLKEMVKRLEVRETPLARAERISKEFSIPSETARQIVLTSNRLADLTEELCARFPPEKVLPWVMGPISSKSDELSENFEEVSGSILEIVEDFSSGKITDLETKRRIDALFSEDLDQDIGEMSAELGQLINEMIDTNPSIIEDYRQNEKAANFIIGQVIRSVKGKYSSSEVVDAVHLELGKRV